MTDLQRIADWLARRDLPELTAATLGDIDVVVLCGSAVLAGIDVVIEACRLVPDAGLILSGGRGHSTPYLVDAVAEDPPYQDVTTEGASEASILGQLLTRREVRPGRLALEERSTNCGENASFTVELLHQLRWPRARLLVVQDPTMQRRTHASFARALKSPEAEVVSYAPFRPVIRQGDVGGPDGRAVWSRERFQALVLGEIRRLQDDEHGYGPRGAGYLDHVDVPSEVLSAYQRLVRGGATARASWDPRP